MSPSELRIGNYFQWKDIASMGHGVDQITNGQQIMDYIDFKEGIPLTEEWLLKFGFELHEESHHKFPKIRDLYDESKIVERLDKLYQFKESSIEDSAGDMDVLVILDPETKTLRSMSIKGVRETFCCADIQFVHQLQNLYFALTGSELTIHPMP